MRTVNRVLAKCSRGTNVSIKITNRMLNNKVGRRVHTRKGQLLRMQNHRHIIRSKRYTIAVHHHKSNTRVVSLRRQVNRNLRVSNPNKHSTIHTVAPRYKLRNNIVPNVSQFSRGPPANRRLVRLQMHSAMSVISRSSAITKLRNTRRHVSHDRAKNRHGAALSLFGLNSLPLRRVTHKVTTTHMVMAKRHISPLGNVYHQVMSQQIRNSNIVIIGQRSVGRLDVRSNRYAPPCISHRPYAKLPHTASVAMVRGTNPGTNITVYINCRTVWSDSPSNSGN